VGKGTGPWRGSALACLMLSFVVPGIAAPHIDTDSAPIYVQILGVACALVILNRRQVGQWVQEVAGIHAARAHGFLFATCVALLSMFVTANMMNGPLPRFNDVFLVGIALTCYLFSWEPAAYLLVLSVLASAWMLPPAGSLRIEGFNEWYRLISFTVVAAVIILLIARIQARRAMPNNGMGMHATSGAD
jgi:K+-sensing histidine kinase KdpD